jgi:prepilin-type N-terminal cleavage/methylation domain-containing protein
VRSSTLFLIRIHLPHVLRSIRSVLKLRTRLLSQPRCTPELRQDMQSWPHAPTNQSLTSKPTAETYSTGGMENFEPNFPAKTHLGQRQPRRQPTRAFSFVELLVVIAVIVILASLLLVALSTANRKAKRTVCLSNFHQVSIGIDLYQQHNGQRFPLRVSEKGSTGKPPDRRGNRQNWRFFDVAIGGTNPSNAPPTIPAANERPLYPYLGASKAFSCPFDAGWDFRPDSEVVLPSAFSVHGCSYQYNATPAGRNEPLGLEGIAGKPEDWVPNPAKFILMHEPPACEHQRTSPQPYLVFWHGAKQPGTLHWNGDTATLEGRRLISPILFVDGHALTLDFTKTYGVMANTDEWQWFKPTQ